MVPATFAQSSGVLGVPVLRSEAHWDYHAVKRGSGDPRVTDWGHENLPAVEQALAAFRQELSVQSEHLAELSRHCKRLADNLEQEKEGTDREGTEGRTAVAPCGDGSLEGVCGPWWPVWWCPFSGWEPPGTGAGWGHTAADQGTTVPRACTEQAAAPSWQAAAGTWWPPPVDGHAGRQSTAPADSAASASALGTARCGKAVACAVRGSSCAGTGGASDIGRRLKNNGFSALVSDHEDESDEEEAEEEEAVHESVRAVEVPAKGGKRDKGGKPQPQQQQKVAAAAVVAAKAPVAAVAATVAVAKVARDAPARQAAKQELHATRREPRDAARGAEEALGARWHSLNLRAAAGCEDGEALRRAAAAETAGACQAELARARSQLEALEAVAAGPAAAVSEAEDWPDFERMADAVADFVCQVKDGGPGLSEDEVAEDFELYDEALESFMRQAGALKGFLQDALVGRADLSEAVGGSQGWSGAEIPKGFKQQACAVDGFLQECMVRAGWSVASVKQQANAVEDFLQQYS